MRQVKDPVTTDVWAQGWLQAQDVGLEDAQADLWREYIDKLKRAHIRLREDLDSLSWAFNKSGAMFTVRLGYQSLFAFESQESV